MLERVPKYTLRKLSVGLASVMIGSGILMSSPKVLAATNAGESTGTAVQSSSQDKDNSKPSTQGQNTDPEAAVQKGSDNSFAEPATTTNAEEKVVATNTQDTTQDQGKQTNANETTQNTTNVGKKDTEVTPANGATTLKKLGRVRAALPVRKAETPDPETPDPTVPDNSANTAIINDKDSLEKTWLETSTERAQVYITVKGTDQKNYVSSYADFKKRLYSEIYTNRMDPNSLELHIKYAWC
ncbi:YSIRK-type signal peptide-containing protein [Lactobacillus crispatus]|uniref:YSIRK-type signal peptide-containing protein n=1 Tax=Lactobacillus crispatus TaxID=47770 RepID=A0A5M9YZT5_9LACO|nr:YSIRK-type signal peptide-containing protein [Lactobacillus crispatus]KAA8792728.1 YSIRK-type signal peptide-containing protein [Lactobacillus crispatus]KAA8811767.1 YSIRK-type signal peptide-containing protein [Lactobacillus crispatus]MBW9143801.1 YSIRK-type signal peptide-containing protein [Lactobacillus crispatus]ORE78647.1 hypothetical protein B6C82_09675 [Lactobacillus crispatus]QWW29069.1 YSIRK-type signal peptide-containing protein [Lactobacillus crispatus]